MYENPFLGKLNELEKDQQMMQHCLQMCGHLSQKEIEDELDLLGQRYAQSMNQLDSFVQHGRSPAIIALAQVQKEYYMKIQQLAEEYLPHYLHSEASTQRQDMEEARMLYAEYSIDFARMAILHALITALDGIAAQPTCKTGGNMI